MVIDTAIINAFIVISPIVIMGIAILVVDGEN